MEKRAEINLVPIYLRKKLKDDILTPAQGVDKHLLEELARLRLDSAMPPTSFVGFVDNLIELLGGRVVSESCILSSMGDRQKVVALQRSYSTGADGVWITSHSGKLSEHFYMEVFYRTNLFGNKRKVAEGFTCDLSGSVPVKLARPKTFLGEGPITATKKTMEVCLIKPRLVDLSKRLFDLYRNQVATPSGTVPEAVQLQP